MTLVRLFVWLFAGCSFAGVNYGFCPWHQLLQVIVFVLRQLFENIDKIFVWIKIVRFCGLDQAEYRCCRFCSSQDKEIRRLKEEYKFLEEASAFFAASRRKSLRPKE